MRSPRLSSQGGQALPLGMALLLIGAAATYFMFNAGQITAEKMALTNTADAVAYSAGVFEARALNYDAITNRAMIANEVAIGQAVSLAAWDRYVQPLPGNIPPSVGVPVIDVVLTSLRAAALTTAKEAETLEPMLSFAIGLHTGALRALSTSQQLMHGEANSALLLNRRRLMERIARENDPDVVVDAVPLADDFREFTQRYARRTERSRMADVVRRSAAEDHFLRDRRWPDLPSRLPNVLGCKVGLKLKRRGGAEYVDVDGWKALDTLSLHWYGIRIRRFRISCTHSEQALGYGSAQSADDLDDHDLNYGGSRSADGNPRASLLAEGNSSEFVPKGDGAAIPSFHALAAVWTSGAKAEQEPRTALAIRLLKKKDAQAYSGGRSAIKPSGRLRLFEGDERGGVMSAVSRVEVFFDRTDGMHPSGVMERGNLFNPYWQARLATSDKDRAAAAARQGLVTPY